MPPTPEPPVARPSVFLSYASEDRPAVRALRDALAAAGLEVWYDENELTGGDAWDRKIRRQIRECTYFMPIISATTNARAEGYFRREWRMGVERTQDMADDVIYLLPVTIDEVDESTARVPEQFLRVQWMHAPAGQPTPALNDLCRRLLGGGTHQMHKPASTAPRATAARAGASRPPMADDSGIDYTPPPEHWWPKLQFFWKKMPRWVRFCLWGVLVLSALNTCTRCSESGRTDYGQIQRKAKAIKGTTGSPTTDDSKDNDADISPEDAAKIVSESVKGAINAAKAARDARKGNVTAPRSLDLDLLPFVGIGSGGTIQSDLFGKLVTTKGVRTKFEVMPLKIGTPLERGKTDGARLVLSGALGKFADGAEGMRVTLLQASDGAELWATDVKADEEPLTASARIYAAVLPFLLKKD